MNGGLNKTNKRLLGFLGTIFVPMLLVACSGGSAVPSGKPAELPEVAGSGSAEPHLALTGGGAVVMSWLEPESAGTALRFATLDDETWSNIGTVAVGENWFVNWADFPSVVPIAGDHWAAHWLAKRPGGTYAYDVAISISEDAGKTWSRPITPHNDGTPTEHGFVTLFPWQGSVGALWLDGRKMRGGEGGHGHGGMTLRAATIRNDLQPQQETEVDALVCDCCQTDVATTSTGPVAVYRDRTEGEVRDIYAARFVDGVWQPGSPVADDGWIIAGCPVNGPAIDAVDSTVVVAWFTAANGNSKVRLVRSSDGGASFNAPIDIAVDQPVGRVDVVLLGDGSSLVSWLRNSADGTGEIRVRRATPQGELGPSHIVATTDAGRMSGFPQMVISGDDAVFAWTDVTDGVTSVRAASAEIKGLIGN